MKNKWVLLILSFSLLLFIAACGSTSDASEKTEDAEENNEADTTETEEIDEESDDRIVVTTVAIAEFLDALELHAVGVPTTYKDLPSRFDDAKEVGLAMKPDLETVLSLEPTHVLSVTSLKGDLEKPFTEHNVPADFLDLDKVDGMFTELEKLGEQYNRSEQAEQIITNFEDKLVEVEEFTEGKETPKVLILMGVPGSYIVGTENSYIGNLVKLAGGENAVTDREEDFISANTEYLQQLDADIILRAVHGAPEEVLEMFNDEFEQNDIWKHFKAVENDRVYDLEETLFGMSANLAVEEAIDELLTMLYPDN